MNECSYEYISICTKGCQEGITAATGALLGAAISGFGNYAMERMNGTTDKAKLGTSLLVGAASSFIGFGVGEVVKKVGGQIAVKCLSKKVQE